MSRDPQDLVERLLVEVWGKGDLSVVPELLDEGIVAHMAAQPTPVRGLAAYRQFVAAYLGALGEMEFRMEDGIAEGERVAVRWSARRGGGEAADSPAPVMGVTIAHCKDGRIAESWTTFDLLSVAEAAGEEDVLEQLTLTI